MLKDDSDVEVDDAFHPPIAGVYTLPVDIALPTDVILGLTSRMEVEVVFERRIAVAVDMTTGSLSDID